MVSNYAFFYQCIVIAGSEPEFRENIQHILTAKGFENLVLAANGKKVFEALRAMGGTPEKMGVIIIHQSLPGCQVDELCQIFSCNGQDQDIPFIVVGDDASSWQQKHGLRNGCLVCNLPENFGDEELHTLVKLFLTIKNERSFRLKQEERLINELAERKLLNAKITYLSTHDELTGLLTRSSLDYKLRIILQRNNNINRNGALLFLDLARFGLVNELEGFGEGDRLIVEVVQLVRRTVRAEHLFARLGYDEYCVYIDDISASAAKKVAQRIVSSLIDFRFISGSTCYNLTVSAGMAMVLSDKMISHPEELISRARQASHIAKDLGQHQVWEYNERDPQIQKKNNDIQWVPIIRTALQGDRFFLEYQPVVNLHNGKISHYEVLLRMTGQNGVIHPDEFIAVAERTGLIHGIDLWVVEHAIGFLDDLPSEMNHVSLAINLSSQAIQDESLLPAIKQLLESTWISSDRITFEITETAIIENFEKAQKMILEIKSLGCHFALDDFGTGFCSFNYLKSFPVDYLKIDGQFIRNIGNDETDQVLVKAMCDIAKKLGLQTIAEFIESLESLNIAKRLGIDYAQGHLFGRPQSMIIKDDAIFTRDLSIFNDSDSFSSNNL